MKQVVIALYMMLAGCAATRESYPSRTATEQLLISEAADDAANRLKIALPADRKCFLDTTNFEGVDARYAVSAIRQKLMEQGIALMETRADADTIIEIRAGALSIDSEGRIILLPGIPAGQLLGIPTPLSYNQWTRKVDHGIAKISAFAYDKASGHLIVVAETVVGKSQRGRLGGQQVVPTPIR